MEIKVLEKTDYARNKFPYLIVRSIKEQNLRPYYQLMCKIRVDSLGDPFDCVNNDCANEEKNKEQIQFYRAMVEGEIYTQRLVQDLRLRNTTCARCSIGKIYEAAQFKMIAEGN